MTDPIESTFQRLNEKLSGRLSMPGDERYAVATAIWAKPVGLMPRAVVHCRTTEDVQSAIRAARDCQLPLSSAGSQHVSKNVRCPLTIWGSNVVSEVP